MRALPEPLVNVLGDAPVEDAPLALSDFLRDWGLRHPDRLAAMKSDGSLTASYAAGDHSSLLERAANVGTPDFAGELRRFRNERLAAIAWRALTGAAHLDETMQALSELADAAVEAALEHAEAELADNARRPENPPQLIVMGMGKLGGGELNFSSDIDLVFAYRATDDEDDDTPIYVRRVAQKLVQVLSDVTRDGFVFRVDTRLRPFGESGPLVADLETMENYYQAHGREWERYAWIKARPIAGDIEGGRILLEMLQPFVYRRYLDYGSFESIRDMKSAIEQQVKRRGAENDIKIGHGGIREIEFIAQVFQLIRGGHDPALQDNRLQPILQTLGDSGHLPEHVVSELLEAYVFLRRAENTIQMWADQQTHSLSSAPHPRSALAYAMDFDGWEAFEQALSGHRHKVHDHFRQVFAAPQIEDETDTESHELAAIWEGNLEDEQALEVLRRHRLDEPAQALSALSNLRTGGLYQSLGERGRRRLTELVPMVLRAVSETDAPDTVLERVLTLLSQVVGRTNYVALLVENPATLSRLISLCGASPWITDQIRQQPVLLDSLLDPRVLFQPPTRSELQTELREDLARLPDGDLERQMDLLRRFKHHHTLRIAAADVSNAMPLMIVSDHLTDLAEVVLQAALDVAWSQMTARYGNPVDAEGETAPFAVIGYGKLGGIELGYGSDLDLVFIHRSPENAHTDGKRQLTHVAFFMRLAQSLIHSLSTQTGAGRAYEVDTRLRPSGRSGLLVTSLSAFEHYQINQAWNWEHQALVRARPVAGDQALGVAFRSIRAGILSRQRDEGELRRQIREMRVRMRENLERKEAGSIDLKQTPGGLIDIEFLAQYFVLRYARECEPLLTFTDTIRIIETMESGGLLDYTTTKLLTDSYRRYRQALHATALQQRPRLVATDHLSETRASVAQCWTRWLGEG